MDAEETNPIQTIDIYKSQADRVSNLNSTLYQIPPIFSTVIGGLWYFSSTQLSSHKAIAAGSFIFAAAVGLVGVVMIYRLRLATNAYYTNLAHFEGIFGVSLKGKSWVPSTFMALIFLLLLSSCLAVAGIFCAIWTKSI